ncbi:MAG TPA: hypothetical protein VGN88_13950 [Phycisphaerae bacterium]|jgi:hypothetical protein
MAQSNSIEFLKQYAAIVGRKMGYIAIAWVVIYFVSQPFRRPEGILMLFAPMIGAMAGLVAGWYMATDAAEDSSLSGMTLWVILVVASVIPMWVVEGVMRLILRWPMEFGGFMLMTAACLLAMASAVWLASTQE